MAKKATKPASSETLEPKVYELGYLVSPAVRDEDLVARIDELKASLTTLGAAVISEGQAEFIDLAYEMARVIDNKRIRFNQAYYGWIKFELDPSRMNELKELLDRNVSLVRYLLIKTIRENTVIGKKPLGKILKAGKREAVVETDIALEEVEAVEEAAEESGDAPVTESETQE